jgi:hypothetical protein
LNWAIGDANLLPDANIICLAAGSTYEITQVSSGENGLPAIQSPITIRGGANTVIARPTAVRETAAYRLFTVETSGNLELNTLRLSGGMATQGGAVLSSGVLKITNTVIENNAGTASGGGVHIANGSAEISNSVVQNNRSPVGAGLYTAGGNVTSVQIISTQFKSNQATNTGGALFNFNANVFVIASEFNGNSAPSAAAVRNQVFGQLYMTNTLLFNNAATSMGGGVLTESSAVTVNNNCFISNSAPSGSAVYTTVSTGAPLNFESNWWGRSTGPVAGEIFGNVDILPILTTVPDFCKVIAPK